MGTPAFAVPSLDALAAATEVIGVVTQPDKPQGRGMAALPPPVAVAAAARGLPVLQPATVRTAEVGATIRAWRPDLIVVAAYGKILPRALLDLPSLAAINVHASLLPRHRGAAPVAAALLAGDPITGITIMAMSEAMDAGDILLQQGIPIETEDTTATLTTRLAALGARTLRDALDLLCGPGLVPVAQDPALVTYAPRLTKQHGRISWTERADVIERKVRALTPWPSAYTTLQGKLVKILRARVESETKGHGDAISRATTNQGGMTGGTPAPGTILAIGEAIAVQTGHGVVDLLVLQMEGRKPLSSAAFSAGTRLAVGQRFDG